jgi:hypothetical protein
LAVLVQKVQEKSGFFLYQGHALYSNDLRPVELPDGKVQKVKDLSVLNRDLSKVIVVDDDALSIQMCKDNAVRITPWYVVLLAKTRSLPPLAVIFRALGAATPLSPERCTTFVSRTPIGHVH